MGNVPVNTCVMAKAATLFLMKVFHPEAAGGLSLTWDCFPQAALLPEGNGMFVPKRRLYCVNTFI